MVSENKIRVLIADDQEIIRHGLALILRTQADIDVVGQAKDGDEALRLAKQLEPDVVLMDIVMPGMNGIAATRQIVVELLQTRVIILTTYDADDMVFDGVRAGAMSYLLKGARSDAVLNAIRSVHRGESQLDEGVARKVLDEFRRLSERVRQDDMPTTNDDLQVEQLTPREMDVLQLLAQGKRNREIADALVLSEGTVKNHISKIMGKLHANDRAQILVKAARRKLVKLR
jgi:DNA-binding NarL/FixJ family response regulator